MPALRRCWRVLLLQLLPLLHSRVPSSILGRPSQARVWPFWPALAHTGAGERGVQTASSHPQSCLCPPFPRTGTLWVLECKSGMCLCLTPFHCGFAKGVCKSRLLLRAARRRTKQSGPCPASFLTAPVRSLNYSRVFWGTQSSFLSAEGGEKGAASLPPKTNLAFCLWARNMTGVRVLQTAVSSGV